jgi:hypothetical protein
MRRFSRKPHQLERRLRDERPAPSDDLILTLSQRLAPPPRRSLRLAVGLAFTMLLMLAFAMTGGVGYAHSKGSHGASAVRHLFSSGKSGHNERGNRGRDDDDDRGDHGGKGGNGGNGHHGDDDDDDDDPDDDQYDDKVVICHKPNKHGGVTIRVSQRALQAHLNHGDHLGKCERRRHDRGHGHGHDDDHGHDHGGGDDDDD